MVLTTYRSSFPQLWEDHDLTVQWDIAEPTFQDYHLPKKAQNLLLKTKAYMLRLFVAGHSAATERILHNLHELLERSLAQPYTLKVVDVLTNPEQAEINRVTATPTLVKVGAHPIRRLVGDLNRV